MNIAVVCEYDIRPDRIGGMDFFFSEFDQSAKELGWIITWFFPGSEVHDFYKEMNVNLFKENLLVDFKCLIIDQDYNFDMLITHFVEPFIPWFQKVKREGINKVVVVDHNPRPIHGFSFKKKLKKRINGFRFMNSTDLVIGVSEYTVAQVLMDFGWWHKKKVKCIHNGIKCEMFKKNTDRRKSSPRFLSTAHLRSSKGIQDLIMAVSLLPTEEKELFKIDLYGDGPFEEDLKKIVFELGLKDNFKFLGSSSELFKVYANYDYLIHPSHMECFSLTILESLCSNVPVVTTTVGGTEEVVVDGTNGFLFPPGDINSLKDLISDLLNGRRSITEDTHPQIEKTFTLGKMVEGHISAIKKVYEK